MGVTRTVWPIYCGYHGDAGGFAQIKDKSMTTCGPATDARHVPSAAVRPRSIFTKVREFTMPKYDVTKLNDGIDKALEIPDIGFFFKHSIGIGS
jgi:hypothetical protein